MDLPLLDSVVLVRDALPEALFGLIKADALAISHAPNYWVPREDIEGGLGSADQPCCRSAVEEAVAHLFRTVVRRELAARGQLDCLGGAEFWLQIYKGGRGLGFHFDKDEFAMKERGEMLTPIFSSVLYLTGHAAEQAAPRQSATAIVNQTFDHDAGCPTPPDPTHTLLVFPEENQYCLFDGGLAHGVIDSLPPGKSGGGNSDSSSSSSIPGGARATLLVNWWAAQPEGVSRMADLDVANMKLTPPAPVAAAATAARTAATALAACAEGGAASSGCDGCAAVVVAKVEAVGDGSCEELEDPVTVDDLLQQRGIALTGAGATHAVLLVHPGLALCPIDTERLVEQQQGQQGESSGAEGGAQVHVAAALVPVAMLGTDSEGDASSDAGS